eukprot:4789848-Amphidinium_carterae.1
MFLFPFRLLSRMFCQQLALDSGIPTSRAMPAVPSPVQSHMQVEHTFTQMPHGLPSGNTFSPETNKAKQVLHGHF